MILQDYILVLQSHLSRTLCTGDNVLIGHYFNQEFLFFKVLSPWLQDMFFVYFQSEIQNVVSDNYRKVRAAADRLMNMKRDLDIQVCGHYYVYTLNKQKHPLQNLNILLLKHWKWWSWSWS